MLCIQTPPKRSGIDSKPICHLDPLLPRFIYVAWPFDSCSLLCDMVPIEKGLKKEYFQWEETFCSTFAEFQFKWFCQFLNQDKQSCPWSLVSYIALALLFTWHEYSFLSYLRYGSHRLIYFGLGRIVYIDKVFPCFVRNEKSKSYRGKWVKLLFFATCNE